MKLYNKSIYGTIGAFLAAFIIQAAAGYANQQGIVDISPDQQMQLSDWLSNLIVSALIALATGATVYQAPANENKIAYGRPVADDELE